MFLIIYLFLRIFIVFFLWVGFRLSFYIRKWLVTRCREERSVPVIKLELLDQDCRHTQKSEEVENYCSRRHALCPENDSTFGSSSEHVITQVSRPRKTQPIAKFSPCLNSSYTGILIDSKFILTLQKWRDSYFTTWIGVFCSLCVTPKIRYKFKDVECQRYIDMEDSRS